MADTLEEDYSIVDMHVKDQRPVRVYMSEGAALTGVISERRGRFIKVENGQRGAVVNLEMISSITYK